MWYTLFKAIPIPTIYPLDNEAKVYSGTANATISTIKLPFFHTYYSLDGSDPEDGYIYENSIPITKTTTVCAKTKFLIFWSNLSQSTFRFENIQNIPVNHVDNNTDKHISVEDFFICLIIVLFLRSIFNNSREVD